MNVTKSRMAGLWLAALMVTTGTVACADEAPPAAPAATDATAGQPSGKPEAGHEATPPPAKDWSVTIGADYYSEYIFRGVDLLKNEPVFVPSVVAKWKGLTAYYYGYYGDGDDALPGNEWYEETDLGADWTQTVLDGKLALTAGALYYVYFDGNSGTDTWELYGKAAYACYFNPFIAINWDIDSFHGGYGVVGVNHVYDVSKFLKLPDGKLTFTPSAQLGIDFGYNSRRTQSNVNFNDVLLGVTTSYNITSAFCVHAGFQWSVAMNSLTDIGQHNEAIANVGASYAF